jgi:E3 ubiquitin-protein ligase MARCH6
MLILLLVSWIAITLLLIAALNTPLFIGHFTFHLLRVPERCFHDPLAFATGIAFLIPVIGGIAKVSASRRLEPLSWIKSFKPNESRAKTIILASFLLQWFVICPLLLGFLYSSFFAGLASMWQSSDAHGGISFRLVSWGTGTLLLNSWAIMCYFELFTKKFWTDLAVGDVQANANGDAGGARQRRVDDAAGNNARQRDDSQVSGADSQNILSWQGEEGAIGRCFKALVTFAVGWEWDKLDKEAMLQDCVLPIFRQLLVACLAPTIVTLLILFLYCNATGNAAKTFLVGGNEETASATLLFRFLVVATSSTQLLISCKSGIQKWFEAAHKIARDDRYLIGEILLNYSPPQTPTTS